MEREALTLDYLAMAMAVRNSGGVVIAQVEQITFAGRRAAACGQTVLYVTERCVFELTTQGLRLTEVAPGIDIERDILAQMDFWPLVDTPALMPACLFEVAPMGLREHLAGGAPVPHSDAH